MCLELDNIYNHLKARKAHNWNSGRLDENAVMYIPSLLSFNWTNYNYICICTMLTAVCVHELEFLSVLHMKHLLRKKINAWKVSQIAVLAIVLVGLLYGFFIAIICGQRITERHYHVLAKQELTKVREGKRKIQQVGLISFSLWLTVFFFAPLNLY